MTQYTAVTFAKYRQVTDYGINLTSKGKDVIIIARRHYFNNLGTIDDRQF